MSTDRITSTRGALRRLGRIVAFAALLAALAVLASLATSVPHPPAPAAATHPDDEYDEEGEVSVADRTQEPDALEISFVRESYRPGGRAVLRVWTAASGVTIQVFHVGPEQKPTVGNKDMQGVPVTGRFEFAAVHPGQRLAIRIGTWQSGLYFATQ